MKRSRKEELVNELKEQINSYSHFYITDVEALDAEKTSALRRMCFDEDVKLVVTKNTLLKLAIAQSDKTDTAELSEVLKGNSSVMFSNVGNVPAKLIKKFGKANGKPELKAAFVEGCAYVGADQLETLVSIKSKEELIGDVIALLQSPAKNVISALSSAGQTIAGVVKTLEERNA